MEAPGLDIVFTKTNFAKLSHDIQPDPKAGGESKEVWTLIRYGNILYSGYWPSCTKLTMYLLGHKTRTGCNLPMIQMITNLIMQDYHV